MPATGSTITQIIPAQPGTVARWRKPDYADSLYRVRPVLAWALTRTGDVVGLVAPNQGANLVPVTSWSPGKDTAGRFEDYYPAHHEDAPDA